MTVEARELCGEKTENGLTRPLYAENKQEVRATFYTTGGIHAESLAAVIRLLLAPLTEDGAVEIDIVPVTVISE